MMEDAKLVAVADCMTNNEMYHGVSSQFVDPVQGRMFSFFSCRHKIVVLDASKNYFVKVIPMGHCAFKTSSLQF